MITYDEAKREANIAKHGLDLADAWLVYNAANKVTLSSPRGDEPKTNGYGTGGVDGCCIGIGIC